MSFLEYNNRRSGGFALIDSIIALGLFATLIGTITILNSIDSTNKDAKILAEQTEVFATTFAKYMKENYNELIIKAAGSAVIISPATVDSKWPANLMRNNIYQQTPCVIVVQNQLSGKLEAIMYFVAGRSAFSQKMMSTVRNAALMLGGMGGIYSNNSVKGNSGWGIDANSIFLRTASQCDGSIANNSIVINLDMLSDWNQDLQPELSVMRAIDRGRMGKVEMLPGHMQNENTLKTNLYLGQSNGVMLDNSKKTRLSMQYNATGTGAPTLGFGNKEVSILVSNTIQPSLGFKAGQACTVDEIGKTVVDQGLGNQAGSLLARSTLVCTNNAMLCGTNSTCYLTSIPNNIIFKNQVDGIQDANGNFLCPTSVPFALGVTTGSGNVTGYYYATNMGSKIGCKYTVPVRSSCLFSSSTTATCPLPFAVANGCFGQTGSKIEEFGTDGVMGEKVVTTFSNIGNNAVITPLEGKLGSYKVTIGYNVRNTQATLDCKTVCSQLPAIGVRAWSTAANPPTFDSSDFGKNSCGCINMTGNIIHALAIVLVQPQSLITSVSCSNMPVYTARSN